MAKLSDIELQARKAWVYEACESLAGRGEWPRSAPHVMDEMKRVRPNQRPGDILKVHGFLEEWRSDRSANADVPEPSGALLQAVKNELHALAAKIRAEADARMDGLLSDTQEAMSLNARLDQQVLDLETSLAQMTSERDAALGRLAECQEHLERTTATLLAATDRHEVKLCEMESARSEFESRCEVLHHESGELRRECAQLEAEANAADDARQAAELRATNAEAEASELRRILATRSFLKPGRNVAPKMQRFKNVAALR